MSGAATSAVDPSAPSSGSSSAVAAIRRHKTATGAALLAGLLIVAAAVYGVYTLLQRLAAAPFQRFSITQLTNTGKVQNAAISPDGRFLLSVQSDNGNESLWLRNIPTGSDTQVLPASGQSFASLVFSPDGNSFYFRETEGGAAAFNLFRAPLLGGSPTLLAKDVDGGPIFSPDGKRIVYSRYNDPELNKWRLLEADADGGNEKVLYVEPAPGGPPAELSWSPDGKRVAISTLTRIANLSARFDSLISRAGAWNLSSRPPTRSFWAMPGRRMDEESLSPMCPAESICRSKRRSACSPIPMARSVPLPTI